MQISRESKERSENHQVNFTNSSFLAEIEGVTYGVKKILFGPKSFFGVRNIF